MSNIFYSQVDKNLQLELQLRGQSSLIRRETDLDYMLSKIANIRITAYKSGSSSPTEIVDGDYGVLGGSTVRYGRYLPGGEKGFTKEQSYSTTNILDDMGNLQYDSNGKVYAPSRSHSDQTNRIGPIITSADITVGDHTMGLLNKATVKITIPNPERDLDGIEDVWMRPGRYMKIEIEHPDTAVLSRDSMTMKLANGTSIAEPTYGQLSELTIPDEARLKELYPSWDTDALKREIRKLNKCMFEGLITSFDLQYQINGQVDLTISMTGTSNIYSDISMWIKSGEKKAQSPKVNQATDTPNISQNLQEDLSTDDKPIGEFYNKLYNDVDRVIKENTKGQILTMGCLSFKGKMKSATDQFIIFGDAYQTAEIEPAQIPVAPANATTADVEKINQAKDTAEKQNLSRDAFIKTKHVYSRYITLAALIRYVNEQLLVKIQTTVKQPEIWCNEIFSCSNYYEHLVSCTPHDILFLPKITDSKTGMNCYGGRSQKSDDVKNVLWFYKDISKQVNTVGTDFADWPGVHTNSAAADSNKIYASRILINLQTIREILVGRDGNGGLKGETNKTTFKLLDFLNAISSKIKYASGGAINMNQITYPKDPSKLLFVDANYLKTKLDTVDNIETAVNTIVTPFPVPMSMGTKNGSIVQEFNITAKLPDSVKTLSYVLNEGIDATEENIAPYMNFMYNSKNPEMINKVIEKYKQTHTNTVKQLHETSEDFAGAPYFTEKQQQLYAAISKHIQYPTDDIRKSQQMTAPIIPYTVDFTIEGVNGFRYGDVLEFSMLPLKYRVNTVFSIIGITHTIATNGTWTTNIKCIMRPSIK